MFEKPSDHRLFFAVQPDEETGERIVRFARQLALSERLGGRPIDRRRLHVTLLMACRSSGPPSHAILDRALRTANRVALRPFTTAFDRVQSWQASAGPLVLVGGDGVSGLERLHDALAEAHGVAPVPHLNPHVSLIWNGRFLPERVIEPFSWRVREFVLIHSVQGQGRHDVLARWRLNDDGGLAELAAIWTGDVLEQLQAPLVVRDWQAARLANASRLHLADH